MNDFTNKDSMRCTILIRVVAPNEVAYCGKYSIPGFEFQCTNGRRKFYSLTRNFIVTRKLPVNHRTPKQTHSNFKLRPNSEFGTKNSELTCNQFKPLY
jgi:hypothetical protein